MLKTIAVLLVVCALVFAAAVSKPNRGENWMTTFGYVPTVDTAVATATVIIDRIHLASTVDTVCSIKDRTTNCGGAACLIWPAISMSPPGTSGIVYNVDLGGIVATSGVQWSCTTAAVVGQLQGAYVK